MPDKSLKKLWDSLQNKKPHMPHFLLAIRLQNLRGIEDLAVEFEYPVSVIAGGNASGKSTVLFAAACAYAVPGARFWDFSPARLFPGYYPQKSERQDERREANIDFDYRTPEGRYPMRWRRGRRWSRSFFGRIGAEQPARPVCLRTLSDLSNSPEARGMRRIYRIQIPLEEKSMTAVQLQFAQSLLPFEYEEVVDLSYERQKFLFATQKNGARYSELHMASGERAVIRLSQEIAQLEGALVLIDEVETSLHPWAQKLLMLQLQRLALRNNLQIIVTTHSPAVLNAVPRLGRIFLERDEAGRVATTPSYRDVIQDALYGRSDDKLHLLCEDEVAEAVLNGVLDYLIPLERIEREAVRIGRDTGADEFPTHAKAFRQFGQINNFVFILDGDQQTRGIEEKIRQNAQNENVPVLFLPGEHGPESWTWEKLRAPQDKQGLLSALGTDWQSLSAQIQRQDRFYAAADDSPAEIAKAKLQRLAESHLKREVADVCRVVGRLAAEDKESDLRPLVNALKDKLLQWRADD